MANHSYPVEVQSDFLERPESFSRICEPRRAADSQPDINVFGEN